MKQFNQLREKTLEEKLKSSDPTGKWISDFVHSDNPKFAGKSKKKRIQMALGAAYAAKRANEEVEQIDELSIQTMKSAKEKLANKAYDAHMDDNKYAARHYAGRALNVGNKIKKKERQVAKEEVEQIDEAEMKTKTAYVPYVYTDSHGSGFGGYDVHYSKEADAHEHVARHGHIDRGGKKGWVEKHEITKHPIHGRWVDANHMRRHGVSEEVDKE